MSWPEYLLVLASAAIDFIGMTSQSIADLHLKLVGEEKLTSTLQGSRAAPKNEMDIKKINRRKAYNFYFIFLCVHGNLQKGSEDPKKPIDPKAYIPF